MQGWTVVNSQTRTQDFEITLPETQVRNSLYKAIEFIDSRHDTTNMGIIQLGAFNKKAKVVPVTPFLSQLERVMHSMTDADAKDGQLLFQLRQFSFAEITGAMSEKGYCYLRAILFAKAAGKYQKISSIDTVVLIKSMDVTKALFRNGSKTITNFISANLTKSAVDSGYYTKDEITRLDSIEKREITLYNTATYTDGLYENFESFMNQKPDRQVTIEMDDDKIAFVKTIDEKGKLRKIDVKDIYAVVQNGKPFIATDYGYYPLHKKDDDFFFTGKAKVNAKGGDVLAASIFFGIIGGLIASDTKAMLEMKIDHINGGFIRLEEASAKTASKR